MIDYKDATDLREKIIGLGETSMKKSYYPDLQTKLEELSRFKALLNAVNDILMIIRVSDLRVIEMNEAGCDFFDIRHKEIANKTLDDLNDMPFFIFIRDILLSNINPDTGFTQKAVDTNFVVKSKDNEFIYFDITIKSSVFNSIEYATVIVKQVNERIKMIKELQESEKRFRELVEFLPLIFFEIDNAGRINYINPYGLTRFGYSEEEAQNMKISDVVIPQDLEKVITNMQRRLRGEGFPAQEYRLMTRDNTIIPAIIESRPIFKDNKVVGLRGVVIDMTERKMLEQHQLKSDRIDSLCVLSGGIAHDFNNILTSLNGSISLAMMLVDKNSKAHKNLQNAELAIQKAKELVNQLLLFSKEIKSEKHLVYLKRIIDEALTINLHDSSNIDCQTYLEDEKIVIFGDPVQIGQVFQNLIINAKQAMPSGGTIKILVKNIQLPDKNNLFLKSGDYVEILISDNGVGIPKDSLDRIFEPYFTTKLTGSGLGLATVYTIIKNHDGAITVDSELGAGTTFKIYLPLPS